MKEPVPPIPAPTAATSAAALSGLQRLIVAHNSADALRWQAREPCPLSTLLVDNASEDDTVTVARELGFDVLAQSQNHGFGRGVMAGLGNLGAEFALVVNPDATIAEPDVLTLLAAAQAYPDCDLFVPSLIDRSGEVFFRHESSLEQRENPRHVPGGLACVPMISGAVMLLRVRPFLAFGGFDPAIFLYFEDDDLALRYRAARRPMIYVPAARAMHLGDRSSAGEVSASRIKDISFGWSRAYLMRKHRRGNRLVCLAGMLAKLPLYLVAARFGRLRRQTGRIRGFVAGLAGLRAPFLPGSDPRQRRA